MNNERRSVMKLALGVLGAVAACAAPHNSMAGGAMRDQVGPYEIEVLVAGAQLPTYSHQGETFIMGQKEERYILRVHNRSARRVEAVVTVDGLDVIDGKLGAVQKRGYMVPAWGSVDIDGWRLSSEHVAAFRFSSVGASYAGKTGQARNVGVIGVAMFPERIVRPQPRPYVPYRRTPYPQYNRLDDEGSLGGMQKSEEAAPSASRGAAAAPQSADQDSLAESAPMERERSKKSDNRPGLGTQFGEQVNSDVHEVEFIRASANNPSVVMGVRYNDRRGLISMGIDVDGNNAWSDANLRRSADPFPVSNGFARPPRGWNGY